MTTRRMAPEPCSSTLSQEISLSIQRIGATTTGAGGQSLPFCQATVANGFVFVSGQVPMDDNGVVTDGGIAPQTHKVIENLIAILAKAGCGLEDVVKANVWLDDARDFHAFNRVYASYFGKAPPARACVQSPMMIDVKVEIEVIALIPQA
jgi:reactive intermediate/imine deaminase